MAEAGAHQCKTLSPYLRDDYRPIQQQQCKAEYATYTIPQLVKDIRDKLKTEETEGPVRAADAVKTLQEGLAFIEKEYDTLPQIIEDYEKTYPEFKDPGAKYCTAERQWCAIQEWVDDADLEDPIKYAIEVLRTEKYLAKTDSSNLPTDHPYQKFYEAEKLFRSIKTCLDQRTEEEESITHEYIKNKDFKKIAESWFTELKTLHDSANDYNTKKKYTSLYAIYLEASQVWKKIVGLSRPQEQETAQNPEWLQNLLREGLKQSLFAKHERFLWHDDWIKKQTAVVTTKAANDLFTGSRRKNFTREAEDVPPKQRPSQPDSSTTKY